MKLLETSVTASAVTVVRNAAYDILAARTRPSQALALWRRVLCGGFQELLCCVLAVDPTLSFGTTFGEVAWRLMHVQHMAVEAAAVVPLRDNPEGEGDVNQLVASGVLSSFVA